MGLKALRRRFRRTPAHVEFHRPDEGRTDATTPFYRPNQHWLLERLQRGEMTAEEFVKLSKEHGKQLRESPMDTQNRTTPP